MQYEALHHESQPRGCSRPSASTVDWMRVCSDHPDTLKIEAFFRGTSYGMHRHDTYAIGVTTFGVQSIGYRGQRTHSTPGDTIVIYPDEVHDGQAESVEGYAYRIVHIKPELLQEILGGVSLPFVQSGLTREPLLHAAAQAMLQDIGAPEDPLSRDDRLLDLALALQGAAGGSRRHRGDQRAARLARDLIRTDPSHRIDLADLARASGRDRWSLSRDFRQFFGTSPSRYMTMRRLDVARRLMLSGTCLADCAAASGFADQSHMTRQFSSAFGMTPSRWMNLQRSALAS